MNEKLVLKWLYQQYLEYYPKFRLPRPLAQKKLMKTRELIKKGYKEDKFEEMGGIGIKDFDANQKVKENLKEMKNKWLQELANENDKLLEDAAKKFKFTSPCNEIKPLKKSLNALVTLVEFKDRPESTDPDFFNELLFGEKSNYSMRNYYREVSYNKFDMLGDVTEWFTAKNKYSEYVDIPGENTKIDPSTLKLQYPKVQKLVEEAVKKVKKSKNFDFTKYANEDGYINTFIVVYAGKGRNTTLNRNDLQPHQAKLNEPIELKDGVKIEKYCLVDELPSYDVGGFCHEVAHTLGLLDFYNETIGGTIVGRWCLMGVGDYNNDGRTPGHICAWNKMKLGWIKPEKISGKPKKYDIPAVTDSKKKIFKIEIPDTDNTEYFLIENRYQQKFDEYLPGKGLLIWHINENACLSKKPNINPNNLFVELMQADGKNELEVDLRRKTEETIKLHESDDYRGDSGDVFPGESNNRTFDGKSNPNSNSNSGKKSNIVVKSISDPETVMTALMGYKST